MRLIFLGEKLKNLGDFSTFLLDLYYKNPRKYHTPSQLRHQNALSHPNPLPQSAQSADANKKISHTNLHLIEIQRKQNRRSKRLKTALNEAFDDILGQKVVLNPKEIRKFAV